MVDFPASHVSFPEQIRGHEVTHIGWMKQCKLMVISGDLPLNVHSLGWQYTDPCLSVDDSDGSLIFASTWGRWDHFDLRICFKWVGSTTHQLYNPCQLLKGFLWLAGIEGWPLNHLVKEHLPLRRTDFGWDNIGGEEEKNKLTLVVYVHDIKVKLEVISSYNYYYYRTIWFGGMLTVS